ncbi:MAG: hypothetical protein AB2796_05235 [Candidatus Thiodiazotropha sp.]
MTDAVSPVHHCLDDSDARHAAAGDDDAPDKDALGDDYTPAGDGSAVAVRHTLSAERLVPIGNKPVAQRLYTARKHPDCADIHGAPGSGSCPSQALGACH